MKTVQLEGKQFVDTYSQKSFWQKIIQSALQAGKEAIFYALVLYYCLQDKTSPTWAKTIIIGALGYFICPLDTIPDLTPIAGFSDDFATLTAAYLAISSLLAEEHSLQAEKALSIWFD